MGIEQEIAEMRVLAQRILAEMGRIGATPRVYLANTLSDVAADMGVLTSGEVRLGTGTPGNGFTGLRIGRPPLVYPFGEFSFASVLNDTLRFGIRLSDGVALVGPVELYHDGTNFVLDASSDGGDIVLRPNGVGPVRPYLDDTYSLGNASFRWSEIYGVDGFFSTATVSGLTAGRVVFAGTAGLLSDDDDLAFTTAAGLIGNESGGTAVDLRWETDSLTHGLFVDASGNFVAVGTSGQLQSALFNVLEVKTATSGTVSMVTAELRSTPASNSSATFRGIRSINRMMANVDYTGEVSAMRFESQGEGSGTISNLYGIEGVAGQISGGGNITLAIGGTFTIFNSSTGTIATGDALRIQAPINNGGGAITTYTALRVLAPTVAGTNNAILTHGGHVIFNEDAGAHDLRAEGDSLAYMLFLNGSDAALENIALLTTAEPNWQTMDRGVFVGDVSTAPTGNPASGGFLYSVAGALTWRGSSGTITTLGAA